MNSEEKGDSLEPEDISSTGTGSKLETTKLPEAGPEDANPSVPMSIEKPEAVEAIEQQVDADGSSSSSVEPAPRTDEVDPPIEVEPVFVKKHQSFFEEQLLPVIEMAPRVLRYRTRREVLVFGISAVAAAAGAGFLLPQNTLSRLGMRRDMSSPGKEWLLNKALRIDDDVAEALYSRNRMVPTYTKSQITPIKNNYNGATPDPGYISGWNLTLEGLASRLSVSLDIRNLLTRFSVHEQITRLVCVEGWSAIAWWAGLRFDDLLRAYPPMSQARLRGWFASKAGVRLRGGLVYDSMTCFAPTHRCRRPNGHGWSRRSILTPRGILTHILCRSTWRRPAIPRPCSPHTSTVSPSLWIMEHHSVCWCP